MRKNKYIIAFRKVIVLLVCCFGLNKQASAQEMDYKAYSLFVYNFMKYVEWPPESQSKTDFIIGILGDSPIIKELQTLANSKKIKGKTIILKRFTTLEECNGCQLLYISSSKSNMMKMLKEQMKAKPILIVGEREGLAKKGAALSFVTLDDDVLKFDINKAEIEQHQLKISSSLITLGIVIG